MKMTLTTCLILLAASAFAQAKTTITPAAKTSTTTTTTRAATTASKTTTTITPAAKAVTTKTTTTPAAKAATTTTTKTTTATPAVKPTANTARPAAIEWTDLDLSAANPPLNVVLKAPKGSSIDYDNGIVIYGADSAYGVMIDMSYSESPATIAERRKDAVDNFVFKFDRFIVDKPDLLVYASMSMADPAKREYHFEAAVEAGGQKYYIHDKWSSEHRAFTQKEIEAMVESAKGLHAK